MSPRRPDGPPEALYASVVVDRRTGPVAEAFTYAVPAELLERIAEGMRVVVPFGRRSVTGYVLGLSPTSDHPAPRPIEALADEPSLLLPAQVALARWISAYYHAPLSDVVRAMIPPGVRSLKPAGGRRRGPRVESRIRTLAATERARPARVLTPAQANAVAAVEAALAAGGGRLLLHGVTGSGKTEVYLEALERCLARGRGALMLVPEISLTPQVTARFAERFAGAIAVLHSRLTPSEKAHEWRRLRAGEARLAIGPRAALFAPIPDLGLIVVDEEHSSTYKQLRVPRYNAVDAAHRLGDLTGAVVLCGSATPSVVSFYRHGHAEADFAGAAVLELPQRIGGDPLPEIEIVDMRGDEGWSLNRPLGERLVAAARGELARGGQVILYLNRRGLAWFARCRRCGESVGCPNCSVSLVWHGSSRRLACHYCGHQQELPPRCPTCGAASLRTVGFGTERIEVEAARLFPSARVVRLDRDTAATRDAYYGIWEAFAERRADVLVGTSLVARGWDLPGVGLVGVVDADQALQYPDYRAAEETFATLVQVAGRARRSGARAVVQTMNPHHYAIRFGAGHDYHGFFAEEIGVREALGFPPFSRLIEVLAEAAEDAAARAMAEACAASLRDLVAREEIREVQVLGPTPALIHRLRGRHRWVVGLRGEDLEAIKPWLPDGRGFSVDVDPI